MKSMWTRTILILAVGLSVAACGKNKSGTTEVPDRTPKAPEAAEKKDALPTPKPDPATADPQGGLKGDNAGTGSIKPPPAGTHEKPKPGTPAPSPTAPVKPAPAAPTPTTPAAPTPGPTTNNVPNSEADSAEPGSIVDHADSAVMINESKKYSGAANDSLREYLSLRQESLADEDQRLSNLKLAYDIAGVQMKLVPQTGQINVTVYLGKNKQAVALSGVLDSKRKAVLNSKTPDLKATVTCMDEGPTCETRVIVIGYQGANVPVIYRRTNLSMDAKFPDNRCMTGECEELYSIFRRTELNLRDSLTLKSAKMDSFEVVQGRSAFKLVAITNSGEVFKVAGPLANPARYPKLNTPTDVRLTADEMKDPQTGGLLHNCLNEALHDVRIIANSGRGNVKLLVKMKLLENGDRDYFELTLNRKTAPIRPLVLGEGSDLVLP